MSLVDKREREVDQQSADRGERQKRRNGQEHPADELVAPLKQIEQEIEHLL